MKRLAIVAALLLLLALPFGCTEKQTDISYTVQDVQTSAYSEDATDSVGTVISGTEELNEYLEAYAALYPDDTEGLQTLTDSVAGFDEDFFDDSVLVLVRVPVTSGSDTIATDSIKYAGSEGTVTVNLSVTPTESGTADMALHHLLYSVARDDIASDATVEVIVTEN